MIFLKIGSAVQPQGADCHEIHIVGHDLRERMAIMSIPGIAEGLRNGANRILRIRLRADPRRYRKAECKNCSDEAFHGWVRSHFGCRRSGLYIVYWAPFRAGERDALRVASPVV